MDFLFDYEPAHLDKIRKLLTGYAINEPCALGPSAMHPSHEVQQQVGREPLNARRKPAKRFHIVRLQQKQRLLGSILLGHIGGLGVDLGHPGMRLEPLEEALKHLIGGDLNQVRQNVPHSTTLPSSVRI